MGEVSKITYLLRKYSDKILEFVPGKNIFHTHAKFQVCCFVTRYTRCSLPIQTLIADIHRIYAVTLKHFHSVILHYSVQNQRASSIRFFHWPIKFFLHIMYITLSNQFLSIYVEELVGLWTLRGNEEQTEYWKLGNYHVVYRCAENYKIQDPKISYIIEIRYWIHFNLILLYSDFSTKY